MQEPERHHNHINKPIPLQTEIYEQRNRSKNKMNKNDSFNRISDLCSKAFKQKQAVKPASQLHNSTMNEKLWI